MSAGGFHWPGLDLPEGFGRSAPELLDAALRDPVGSYVDHFHPAGVCELEAYGVEEARELLAGGVVGCIHCGRPVFIPPRTSSRYDGGADIEATFDAAELRDDPLELEPLEPTAPDPPDFPPL